MMTATTTTDPIDSKMECDRQSVRPVVIDYRSVGVYSVGLSPAESIEVTRVAYATYSRIMDAKPLGFRAAERAGLEAARRRLKVLLTQRSQPEPTPVVPTLDVPALCGGAPVATPVRPDPRSRVVRGWTDYDQYAAHGCV